MIAHPRQSKLSRGEILNHHKFLAAIPNASENSLPARLSSPTFTLMCARSGGLTWDVANRTGRGCHRTWRGKITKFIAHIWKQYLPVLAHFQNSTGTHLNRLSPRDVWEMSERCPMDVRVIAKPSPPRHSPQLCSPESACYFPIDLLIWIS
jgi:hypothetical protein